MFSLFRKAAQPTHGYAYVNFQKVFQLYTALYTTFDPASMPDDSTDNPLALARGIAMGIAPDISDALEDPTTEIRGVSYLRNLNDDWIVHGEYTREGAERLFMMMFGAKHVIEDDELDTFYVPYFIFDGSVWDINRQTILLPETVATGLKTTKDELLVNAYVFPREFYQALCFADASFCQILANSPVDLEGNQQWVDGYPPERRREKITAIHGRNFDDLRAQITGQAAGNPLVAGLRPL